jgi:hypothetical protein
MLLPLVAVLFVYIVSDKLIVRRTLAVGLSILLILIYPMFNLYRSVVLNASGDGQEIGSVFELYLATYGGSTSLDLVFTYFNQMLDRFVGIEGYMIVAEANSVRDLPASEGLFANMLNMNNTMRMITGLEDVQIGIAPSFLGGAFLMARDPYMTVVLAAAFCLLFVFLYRVLSLAFPRVGIAVSAPLGLVIFSILTDGLLTSLYWDLPALFMVCMFASTFARRASPLGQRSGLTAYRTKA